MTAAIYVRASPGGNDGEAQLHELRQHAARLELGQVVEFVELDTSGDSPKRPVWDRLMREIRAGAVSVLLVTELSRIGRMGGGHMLTSLDTFRQYGVRLISTRMGVDYATPAGRIIAAVVAEIAADELQSIRKRVKAGMVRAKAKGTRSGNPIGRPEVSVDLERLLRLRADGKSWAACARLLGVPVGTLRGKIKAANAAC